jgi:hypothetical protein
MSSLGQVNSTDAQVSSQGYWLAAAALGKALGIMVLEDNSPSIQEAPRFQLFLYQERSTISFRDRWL